MNFSPVTKHVIFEPHSSGTTVCTEINITNDDKALERDAVFHVDFELPPGSDADKGLISQSAVIILDDEGKEDRHMHS